MTIALAVGLGLGALTAGVLHSRDRRSLAAGLAVTTVAVWVVALAGSRMLIPGLGPAHDPPPLGLPAGAFRTSRWTLGGLLPLLPVLWAVIGAASAAAARMLAASRATARLSGMLGAILISISFFTARPASAYLDHMTVESRAFGNALMLIAGALLGTAIAHRMPIRRAAAGRKRDASEPA